MCGFVLSCLLILAVRDGDTTTIDAKRLVQETVQLCVSYRCLGPSQVEWLFGSPMLTMSGQSGPPDYHFDWPITAYYRCDVHIWFQTSQFPHDPDDPARRVHGGIQ
jgi:hypothetical protein